MAVLFLGCQSESQSDAARPPVRLNPHWAMLGDSAGTNLITALQDRDVQAAVSLARPVRLQAQFGTDISPTHLKVHGARNLRIEVAGRALNAVGQGWERLSLEGVERNARVEVLLTPQGPDASLGELELWGSGRPAAPRSPELLVAAAPGQFENLVRVSPKKDSAKLELGTDASCASFQFDFPHPANAVRRAYLTYEGPGLKSSVVLRRSLNGWPASGGFWMGPGEAPRRVIDEIDPRQLSGSNALSLCLPDEATSDIPVQGLTLVAELDDGTNVLDRDSQVHASGAWDVSSVTSAAVNENAWSFLRPMAIDRLEVSSGSPRVVLSSAKAKHGGDWTDLATDVVISEGEAFALSFDEATPSAEALSLRFADPERVDLPKPHVAEVRVAGSSVGPKLPKIVVTYPTAGEHFGSVAYVSGFVDGESLTDRVDVTLDGEPSPGNGTFAQLIRRTGPEGTPWTVELVATIGQTTLKKTLVLNRNRAVDLQTDDAAGEALAQAEDALYGAPDEVASATIGSEGGEVVLGERVKLKVPQGAMASRGGLSIQRKSRVVVPKLDPALVNVTSPSGAGYKFRPAGHRFAKPARVVLPFDLRLLPGGISPDAIRTYYYDESLQKWQQLPRVALDRARQTVESETDHFTFMINAVLVLPDHPGPSAFNPTSLKDLKAAEPSANIDLIQAPQPNNQGSAHLVFPIRLPKARGDYQPSVNLTYDSSTPNGWIGVGWSIPVSRIEVDTRFGVPAYNGTEVYMLNGEPLVPVGPEACNGASPGVRYVRRVEGAFDRIRRCGNVSRAPAAPVAGEIPYYWEVTSKDGTVFIYGKNENARLSDYKALKEHVARWMLESVEDTNGNVTRYNYLHDDEGTALGCPQAHGFCEPFRELYLASIAYSANNRSGLAARYRVEFSPVSNTSGAIERSDTQSSARTGFKVVTRHLLSKITVYFDDTLIRRYELDYVTGDFGKQLLEKIRVFGADGAAFYAHTFEYERKDENLSLNAFSAPTRFVAEPADPSTLTDSEEVSRNYHLFVGLSPNGTKDLSVGVRGGYDRRESDVRSLLVDLNGDGLPDRLSVSRNQTGEPLYYATFNHAAPGLKEFAWQEPTALFSPQLPDGDPYRRRVPNLFDSTMPPDLGKETSDAFVGGLEVNATFASFSLGISRTSSSARSTILDADGDGLIDYASPQGVLFQRERKSGCVPGDLLCSPPDRFTFSAGLPIAADLAELAKNDPDFKAAELKVMDEMFPEDALLQWVAPFGGTIDLEVKLKRRAKARSEAADGVVVQLFLNNTPLPVQLDGDSTLKNEVHLAAADDGVHWVRRTGIQVGGRDRLYFKVSTKDHFAVQAATTPVPLDELTFEPVIRYAGQNHALVDSTGGKVYEYALTNDFRLAGDPIPAIALGVKGRVEAKVTLDKRVSSDDVRVCVQRFKIDEELRNRVCESQDLHLFNLAHDAAGRESRIEALWVQAGEKLVFRQESDAPMDPATADIAVSLTVLERCLEDSCESIPREGPDAIVAQAPVHVALHVPARSAAAPYVVPESGEYEIRGNYGTPSLLMPGFLVLTRNGQQQLFKQRLPALKPVVNEKTRTLRLWLQQGDQLNFELHSEIAATFLSGWKSQIFRVGVDEEGKEVLWHVKDVQAAITFDADALETFAKSFFREKKPLSGGYRGWRFGQWNGNFAFNEDKIGAGEEDNPYEDMSPEEALAQMQEDALDKDSKISNLLKLYVPMAPKPEGTELRKGHALWSGPDGFAYVGKGVMHAGRKGGYAVGAPDSTGEHGGALTALRLGNEVRSAVAVNISAGVGLLSVLNGSLGYGWSNSKVNVMDMNGDRLVDVVTPQGMMLTDQLRVPRRRVNFGSPAVEPGDLVWEFNTDGIQQSKDFSVSAGLGVGTLITGITSAALEVMTGTRLPVGLIANTGFATSRQAVIQNLIDVNGDGLPDRVRREAGQFYVQLNLGNRFADKVDRLDVSTWEGGLDGLGQYVEQNLADSTKPIEGDKNSDRERNDRQKGLVGVLGAVHNANVLEHSTAMTFTESLGLSSPFAGVSTLAETSLSKTPVQFIDVTGDGLPDYVKKGLTDDYFYVQVNKGTYFSPAIPMAAPRWKENDQNLPTPCFRTRKYLGVPGLTKLTASLLGQGEALCSKTDRKALDTVAAHGVHTDNKKLNGGFYLTIPIPTPIGSLLINPGFDQSHRESGFELGMMDLNGDGLADHVLKTRDGQRIYARMNQMGGGNLLRKVHQPLGGSMQLSYVRVGNTVSMPESRYVLHTLTMDDGFASATNTTGHVFTSTFDYQGGVYDRREREFYGFGVVRQKNPDGTLFTRSFDTSSYTRKGLMLSEEHQAPSGGLLSRSDFSYVNREVQAAVASCVVKLPFPLNETTDACRSIFPELRKVEMTQFEVGGQLVTSQTFGYDAFGNVGSVLDTHHSGESDDTLTVMTYTGADSSRHASYIVGKAKSVMTSTVAAPVRKLRQRVGRYDARGNLEHLDVTVNEQGTVAYTDLTWTREGNLHTFEQAPNEKSERYKVTYGYDEDVVTHVSSIEDSFGLSSSVLVDPRFGQALHSIDVAGNCTVSQLDSFGRLKAVFGPDDVSGRSCAPKAKATLLFEYFPHARPAYAVTHNKLPQNAGTSAATLDTVSFIDGMARIIQTKKSAEVFLGGSRAVGFVASGHVDYDAMGRVRLQGQPVFSSDSAETFVEPPNGAPKLPSEHSYDFKGRPLMTRFPDATTLTYAYSLGMPARLSGLYLKTDMVDAEDNRRVQYLDIEKRQVAFEEHLGQKVLTTNYGYSPMGELTEIIDANGHTTTVGYDLSGQRVSLMTPDTGLTEFRYDLAGNLTRKIDANLRALNKELVYVYHYNRLASVVRPFGAPISYEYGDRMAPENGAGRIVRVSDDAGVEERGYDRLGALSRLTRHVRSLRPGERSDSLTMRFDFDHFGRLLTVEYPDGEVLSYGYDAGGLLKSAMGRKKGVELPYVREMLYDEFGQRVAVSLGNGTLTDYSYNAATRRLKALKTALPGASKRLIQNLVYSEYDKVGNLKQVTNALGVPTARIPGTITHKFQYDDLYRLVHAEGTAEVEHGTQDTYVADFGYDNIHNMTRNTQVHSILESSGQSVKHQATNHDLSYQYELGRPHIPYQIGNTLLTHSASGNTLTEEGGSTPKRRRYVWSEENWLKEVYDNGNVTSFLYDSTGERVVKRGKYGEMVQFGQWFSLRNGTRGTKHIFAGPTRVASRLDSAPLRVGGVAGPGTPVNTRHPRGIARACEVGEGAKVGLEPRCPTSDDPVDEDPVFDDTARPETFWYHSDHLGSSTYLTDERGEVFEHREYFPYGDTWIEEGPRKPVSEYGFTAKPQDPETGLIYFGARYYDARQARWLSPDPAMLELKDPSPTRLNIFQYALWNPLRLVDPDGRQEYDPYAKDFAKGHNLSAQGIEQTFREEINPAAEQVMQAVPVGGAYVGLTGKRLISGEDAPLDERVSGAIGPLATVSRFFKGLFGLGRAARVADKASELVAPVLKGTDARSLMGEVYGHMRAFKGAADDKANLLEAMFKQVSDKVDGWSASRSVGSDGSHIFMGTRGQGVVVRSDGKVFRGELKDFAIEQGGQLRPNYDTMKALE